MSAHAARRSPDAMIPSNANAPERPAPRPGDRARTHRRVDEFLTERVETFLSQQQGRDAALTPAQLADVIGIERLREGTPDFSP